MCVWRLRIPSDRKVGGRSEHAWRAVDRRRADLCAGPVSQRGLAECVYAHLDASSSPADLVLAVVGEKLDDRDDLVGCSFQRKKAITRVQIWLRDANDIDAVNGIGLRLGDLLQIGRGDGGPGDGVDLNFSPHDRTKPHVPVGKLFSITPDGSRHRVPRGSSVPLTPATPITPVPRIVSVVPQTPQSAHIARSPLNGQGSAPVPSPVVAGKTLLYSSPPRTVARPLPSLAATSPSVPTRILSGGGDALGASPIIASASTAIGAAPSSGGDKLAATLPSSWRDRERVKAGGGPTAGWVPPPATTASTSN